MNQPLETNFMDMKSCSWCGVPHGSTNLVRQLVCVRCYELLIKANLRNEEIFARKEDKRKILSFQPDKVQISEENRE